VGNYPFGLSTQVNDSGLLLPEGVAVDSKGDLWVADSGNGRVLRFPRPFDQPPTSLPRANLVIGQTDFISKVLDVSSQNMKVPIGIGFTTQNDLVVSDQLFNRILVFKHPAGGDFVNGKTADLVIGQPNFISTVNTELSSPRAIALDSSDRLYVVDSGNNRVVVYRSLTLPITNDPAPVFVLVGATPGDGFSTPTGIAVDQTTGEIWVADPGKNRVVRFPQFDTVTINPVYNLILFDVGPTSVALDAAGSPATAEAINRIAFFYRAIGTAGNGANYFRRFAPGMLTTIKPSRNSNFGSDTVVNTTAPVPTTLGNVQVLVAGVPSPLIYVSPAQINFMIPSSTPVSSDPVEFQVVKASTNEVLASFLYKIDPYSPGLFTRDASGSGALAVVNEDGSINDGTHPAKAGSTISLYGTGCGVVPGAPPDSTLVTTAISTPITPRVFINQTEVSSTISYSGLAPGAIGEWQINVKVPSNAPPATVTVVVTLADFNSAQDPDTLKFITTTIRVIQ